MLYAPFFQGASTKLLLVHIFESCFAAQADLSGIVNVDDFDSHIIAFAADIGNFVYAIVSHFGDMEQAIHAGEDFDESTEIAATT